MQLGFFVRSDRAQPPQAGDTVAFQRGAYLPPALAAGGYQLYEVVDPRPGLEMLGRGRVDAVFFERGTMEHYIALQPRLADSVRWVTPPLEVVPTYMAVSRSHPQTEAWLGLLNREIRSSVRN
jgi:ABC-type amino acid transport substrate-binding protein